LYSHIHTHSLSTHSLSLCTLTLSLSAHSHTHTLSLSLSLLDCPNLELLSFYYVLVSYTFSPPLTNLLPTLILFFSYTYTLMYTLTHTNSLSLTYTHTLSQCHSQYHSLPIAKMHAFVASKELVRLGADPGHRTADDTTAIHYLCSGSPNDHTAFQQVLSYMLQGRVDLINACNHNKETPLHYAVTKRASLAVVSALLACAHIDVNVVNSLGSTPLEICILRNNLKMAGLLVHAGAKVCSLVISLRSHTHTLSLSLC
jgi:Ankyrin repeats (3 copies)